MLNNFVYKMHTTPLNLVFLKTHIIYIITHYISNIIMFQIFYARRLGKLQQWDNQQKHHFHRHSMHLSQLLHLFSLWLTRLLLLQLLQLGLLLAIYFLPFHCCVCSAWHYFLLTAVVVVLRPDRCTHAAVHQPRRAILCR